MKYYKVDVLIPNCGYSFLVSTSESMDADEVVKLANEKDLFECEEDVDYAQVEEIQYGDYDYNGLKNTLTNLD